MSKNYIQLTNLTPHQVELLETMWDLEDITDVEAWQATLDIEDRIMSETLMRLVLHEIVEELVVEDLSLANEYLTRFRL